MDLRGFYRASAIRRVSMVQPRGLTLAVVLVAVLGGPAIAGGHNLPIKGPDRAPPPGAAHQSFTAVVNAKGHLVRGAGATGASQPEGKGTYEVDFDSDITGCAYVATLGQTGSTGTAAAGDITVVGRSGVPSGLFVETADTLGHLKNRAFHVDVGC
jgi:hypothetical protein